MISFPQYRLEIEQTWGQVGLRIQNAELQMEMQPSPVERTTPPEWRALPRRAEVEINTDAFKAEFDIENPVAWTTKKASQASAKAESGTRWAVQNGDLCYRATPGDTRPFQDYAMRYFAEKDAREYVFDIAPKSKPQITGHVDPAVRYELAPMSDKFFSFSISASRPELDVYLEVQPELRVHAEKVLDQRV